jgi:hypothetical protein
MLAFGLNRSAEQYTCRGATPIIDVLLRMKRCALCTNTSKAEEALALRSLRNSEFSCDFSLDSTIKVTL